MKQKLRLGDCYALTTHKRKQTTIRYISLLAVLTIMCLYAVKQVSAQEAEPAATAVADINPLQIGDTIPEWLWSMPLQVVNHPEGRDTITLAEYRGKLIILDFWATWCGSCIAAMPDIHELGARYQQNMMVIPVSDEVSNKVRSFLLTNKVLAPLRSFSVVADTALGRFFPHNIIPHYVWITPNGMAGAASAAADVTSENIELILSGREMDYKVKNFIDPNRSLYFQSGFLPEALDLGKFSVFIRGHIPSLPTGTRYRKQNGKIIGVAGFNLSIGDLYQIVANNLLDANYSRNRIHFQGDTTRYPEIVPGNRSLLVNDPSKAVTYEYINSVVDPDSVFNYMLADLNQCSGYTASIQQQLVKCYLLQNNGFRSNNHELLDHDVPFLENQSFKLLGRKLDGLDVLKGCPVIDETGISERITISVDPFDSLEELQNRLAAVGLRLVESERIIPIFVLKKS